MIILAGVFLAAMNFLGRYYYFIYLAFVLFCIFYRGKFKMDAAAVPLFILSVCILLFAPSSLNQLTYMIKPFTYPLCYIIGYNLLKTANDVPNDEKIETRLKAIICILGIGLLIHLLLNMVININISSRNSIDFWSKEVLSATGQTALSCLAIGVACALLFSDTKFIHKLLSLATLTLILLYNLILAGRTIIIMVVLMLLLSFAHLLITDENRKQKTTAVFFVLFLIAAAFILYQGNVFNIQDLIKNSNLYQRFFGQWGQNVASDGRLQYKRYFLSKLFDYPFGGAHIRHEVGSYAHDLYLDTYDEAGFIAFFAVISYMLISLKHLWRCLKDRSINFSLRQLIFCTYTVLYAEFLIEPILLGMPWIFASFCLIDGALSYYLNRRKTVAVSEKNGEWGKAYAYR
ncbi:MAG TPA: hypothetical protein PLV03_00205 [Clostridiales bacterium]|nr:hypothetical protein [Clostridiales bacterium]